MEFVIDRRRRDALHAEAVMSYSDIATAFESDDYLLAQQLRPQLEAVSRLLDDIGWGAQDVGERFVITMPAAELALALLYLGDRVERGAELAGLLAGVLVVVVAGDAWHGRAASDTDATWRRSQ